VNGEGKERKKGESEECGLHVGFGKGGGNKGVDAKLQKYPSQANHLKFSS
jgi:hypothetical protein